MQNSSGMHRAMLNALGVVVLLLGLIVAGVVYWSGRGRAAGQLSNADGSWQDTSLAPADSKKFSRDVEMYNGKIGVLIVKWWALCDQLKRPESVGIMIAVGSAAAAFGCFHFARQK